MNNMEIQVSVVSVIFFFTYQYFTLMIFILFSGWNGEKEMRGGDDEKLRCLPDITRKRRNFYRYRF